MAVSRIVPLFASLLLVVSCAGSTGRIAPEDHPEYENLQPEIARLVKKVRHTQGNELFVTLQELVAYDVFAVEKVSELIDDPNPRIRSNALWVLFQINDPEYPDVNEEIDDLLIDSLGDADRLVRFEAASGLVSRNRWEHIPILFEGLEDDSARVRYTCHATLQDVTAQNFGYAVDGEVGDRQRALQLWRQWYEDWTQTRG